MNGKVGSVLDIVANVVFVKLNHGPVIPVPTIRTDEGLCAPLIRGHAMTIAKSMGSTIPHVTLYCEENMSAPGCGYVAMSRVKTLDKFLMMGFPCRKYFRPCERLQ